MKKCLLILSMILLTACSSSLNSKSLLDSNQNKWQAHKINHYRFDLKVHCLCGHLNEMPFSIEVSNGETVSISNNASNTISIIDITNAGADSLDYYAPFITIDKIFAYAQIAASEGHNLKGQYDLKLGIPTWICIDCEIETPPVVDAGISITITNFKTLP
jgi:hypothetical protein